MSSMQCPMVLRGAVAASLAVDDANASLACPGGEVPLGLLIPLLVHLLPATRGIGGLAPYPNPAGGVPMRHGMVPRLRRASSPPRKVVTYDGT
jgi:hypothetical protein